MGGIAARPARYRRSPARNSAICLDFMPDRLSLWTFAPRPPYAADMSRPQIRQVLLRHAPAHGTAPTAIDGLDLIRVTRPVPLVPSLYPASLCLLVDGRKRVYFRGEAHTYGEGTLLCCTMPLPVKAEVPDARPEAPVLGLMISLDDPALVETLVAAEATGGLGPEGDADGSAEGLVVAPEDDAVVDAIHRLLQLLDDPCARSVLVDARRREFYFALLRSEAGRAVCRTMGPARNLARALAHIHAHITEPLAVDDLARIAGMSRAAFHRRFKAATGLSPLQFIKAVRLNNAAMMLAGGVGVAEAAGQVGYGSPSQFSREFRRLYGVAPRQWARNPAAARPSTGPRSPSPA
ncbi:MAG: AraC family transcriptional regulator [Deltaproteobacteria bacterium]|nr:MAG: AraC family transcriptional regulator [Deltaproteobacteria bacterium]